MVGNLWKRKVDCSRKDQLKKKWSWTKAKRKKKERKEVEVEVEVEVQFELYCVKLVELVLFEKKNYAPLVFRNYFVLYISFFIVNPLTLVAPLQPC